MGDLDKEFSPDENYDFEDSVKLCNPWTEFDCELTGLTIIQPSALSPIIIAVIALLNAGWHGFMFIQDDFYKGKLVWKFDNWLSAGYNVNILLSFFFKGLQFVFWCLSFLGGRFAWWYMFWSQINAFGDYTWHLAGVILWCVAIGVDYVKLEGNFLTHFIVEWGVIVLMWVADSMFIKGLTNWYFYGIEGQTDDKFCNAEFEDCGKKQVKLDRKKKVVMSDYVKYAQWK